MGSAADAFAVVIFLRDKQRVIYTSPLKALSNQASLKSSMVGIPVRCTAFQHMQRQCEHLAEKFAVKILACLLL